MIKGVFLDLGGTLFSYRNVQPTLMVLLGKMVAKLELEQDAMEIARHYQLANKEVDKLFADKPFYLVRDYFNTIFINLLGRIDKQHLHSYSDWFVENQCKTFIDCMELMPHCHKTLAQLKDMGLYLSAVSNIDDNMLERLLDRAPLHQWLTHWTSSEAAKSCKPDRRFFEIALSKAGLSADQVLFVGDSLVQDIQGADALGMTTVWFSEVDQPVSMYISSETSEPDFRITSLSELPKIVENIGG